MRWGPLYLTDKCVGRDVEDNESGDDAVNNPTIKISSQFHVEAF